MTSRLLKTVHETAQDFADAGLIDAQTLREFDATCLPPVRHYTAEEVRNLRLRCRASQAVFAAYLNTSVSTVKQWEAGDKQPSGMALKLLSIVQKHGLQILA